MEQKINLEKDYQIKIFYKLKNIIIGELSLDINNASFGDIINHFKNNIKKKYPQFILKSKYYYLGKELEQSNKISNLIMNQTIILERIKQINLEIFLDEIYNIYDKDLPNYTKIIMPNIIENSLELYVYFPNKGVIDIEEYDKKIYNEYILNKVNSKTSYCNTINNLFLSGGEYNKEIIDDFWSIDNSIYSIKNFKMPSPKCNHTMFPINTNHIMIVGGNDYKTYLFDINKNEFSNYENTNNIHFRPTLFIWQNFIYCFSEQNKSIIAERLLLSPYNNKWEKIALNFISNNELLNTNSLNIKNYVTENILIILGGIKRLEYDPSTNNIKYIKNENFGQDLEISPNDKNLYKISKYYNIFIPENFEKDKKLIVLNKKNRIFHKMSFSPYDGTIKIKLQYEEKDKIDIENNISIKVEYLKTLENNDEKDSYNKESFTFKLSDDISEYRALSSRKNINKLQNNTFEQLINKTPQINDDEEDKINIYDGDNDKETKIIPSNKTLSSGFLQKENNNDINKGNHENGNLLFDEMIVENENKNNNQSNRNQEKINYFLSKDSIEDQINKGQMNNNMIKQNDDDNKNDSIKPEKRKLDNMDIVNNNGDKNENENSEEDNEDRDRLNDVFSFDAYEMPEFDNKKEDQKKDSNIFKNNNSLLLSKNTIEEQLKDKEIELETNKKEKEIDNNRKK